ncbi:MAG: PEGA domain-containing protein [Thermodesulfobacteriota bacterium]|nr:PEGA domain-containing protein [Thermodesulfobacteriota bacterium]
MNNAVFLLSFILTLFLAGCGTPKESTFGVGNEGTLRIICSPNSAKVFVDGVSMGKANRYDGDPGYIKLDSGTHRIEIRKEGYIPYTKEVYSSRSLQTIEVTLKKSNP